MRLRSRRVNTRTIQHATIFDSTSFILIKTKWKLATWNATKFKIIQALFMFSKVRLILNFFAICVELLKTKKFWMNRQSFKVTYEGRRIS